MLTIEQYPIFGREIQCPHCHQTITGLILTESYICPRHGAFEAEPGTGKLVHLHSGRYWLRWNNAWHRQHTHPDGVRFEIHDALERLLNEGYSVTKIVIAQRYKELMKDYLGHTTFPSEAGKNNRDLCLYGLRVEFSPESADESWSIINFDLEKQAGFKKIPLAIS